MPFDKEDFWQALQMPTGILRVCKTCKHKNRSTAACWRLRAKKDDECVIVGRPYPSTHPHWKWDGKTYEYDEGLV